MNYIVTVGYESDQLDRNGNPRLQKVKYVVESETIEEVSIVMAKYRASDSRGSSLLSVSVLPIECVINPTLNPNLYKK